MLCHLLLKSSETLVLFFSSAEEFKLMRFLCAPDNLLKCHPQEVLYLSSAFCLPPCLLALSDLRVLAKDTRERFDSIFYRQSETIAPLCTCRQSNHLLVLLPGRTCLKDAFP